MKRLNFGRNVQIDSKSYFTPKTEADVLAILKQVEGRSICCMGRLRSWSQVLDSPNVLLDLSYFHSGLKNSRVAMLVDVGAGCQIKRLLSELEGNTLWTLPSVGFITEQTIAGAISTGPDGSGRHSLSHTPRTTSGVDPYDAMKERTRARNAALALAGRDIGELPEVVSNLRYQGCPPRRIGS